MLTLAACHVITAAVLLDGRQTFGTFFRVGRNPVRSLGVILALLQPHLDQRTGWRLMIVQTASETETVLACAVHCRHNLVEISSFDAAIYGKFAIWGWTPFEVVFVVDVCSSE